MATPTAKHLQQLGVPTPFITQYPSASVDIWQQLETMYRRLLECTEVTKEQYERIKRNVVLPPAPHTEPEQLDEAAYNPARDNKPALVASTPMENWPHVPYSWFYLVSKNYHGSYILHARNIANPEGIPEDNNSLCGLEDSTFGDKWVGECNLRVAPSLVRKCKTCARLLKAKTARPEKKQYLGYYEIHVGERTFYEHVVIEAQTRESAAKWLKSERGEGWHRQAKGILGELTLDLVKEYLV
jgi:hypothetical protein